MEMRFLLVERVFFVWVMNLQLLANQTIPFKLFPFASDYLFPLSALESKLIGARCVNRIASQVFEGQGTGWPLSSRRFDFGFESAFDLL